VSVPPTAAAVLLRLLLAGFFGVTAVLWLLSTEPTAQALVTVQDRQLNRLDLAAAPLLLAGLLLGVLAVLGRRRRPARAATVLLVLSGVAGWAGTWWVSAEPVDEGQTVARLSHGHGLTQGDLLILPVLAVAGICGLAALVTLLRSTRAAGRS